MASNDYFNHDARPNTHAMPYRDYSERRGSPLPSQSAYTPHSPYGGDTYPYSHQTPAQSYSGASGGFPEESDPFDDGDAIPLNSRKAKHDSTHSIAPILPHEQEDPFVRDVDQRRKKRLKQDDGWFTGKITWVVFVLTIIQLIVFIAEIIKNGKLVNNAAEEGD